MLFVDIYRVLLNSLYFLLKLFPTDNKKIVFISRQSNKISLDYRLMVNDIKKRYSDYKIIILTKRIEKRAWDVIVKNTIVIFKQMYNLATSKICVIDGYNISVSLLKHKKSLKIIQIWHSMGAIKKFGYQTLYTNKDKKIAKKFRMHKNYDYIISSSRIMNKYFKNAFNYDNKSFVNLSLPRVDYLINNHKKLKKEIYLKHSYLKKKKNILYVPTFRKNHNYQIDYLIKNVDFNKYNLIIKLHPCMKCVDYSQYDIKDYSAFQLLSIADYVITDYSAFSIESLILEKPTFIYAYDYDDYVKQNGVNINLKKEFEKYFFKDCNKLIDAITKKPYDLNIIKSLKKKYVKDYSGHATEKLVDFIIESGSIDE